MSLELFSGIYGGRAGETGSRQKEGGKGCDSVAYNTLIA